MTIRVKMKDSDSYVLRERGWLSRTSPEFQDAVLERCDLLKLGPGTTVFLAGDDTGGMFGIVDGRVELHLPAPEGAASLAHIGGRARGSGTSRRSGAIRGGFHWSLERTRGCCACRGRRCSASAMMFRSAGATWRNSWPTT